MPRGSASATPATLALDATAQALDLPDWDARELEILRAVARRLKLILVLNQDGDPQITRLARKSLEDLDVWWLGDLRENRCHAGVLGLLQRLNGLLDRLRGAA